MADDREPGAEERAAATLMKLANGYQVSQALHVAAKLRIADLLQEGPRHADELARATGTHAPSLHRLLRALASLGVFVEDQGRFRLTPLAEPLRSGARWSVRAAVTWYGEPWNWQPWGSLLHSVRTGQTAFDQVYGVGYYEYLASDATAGALFSEAMASLTVGGALAGAYDFTGIERLVDVGGGYGQLLAAVLRANPTMRGILLDRPDVVEGAKRMLRAAGSRIGARSSPATSSLRCRAAATPTS
jgi:O-methyltransferase domain/Dimerisation domain